MLAFGITLLSIHFLAASAQTNPTLSNVTTAFTKAKIVPDVLKTFNPSAVLDVIFTDPMTSMAVNVTPGVNLSMEQTSMEPQFFLLANSSAAITQSYVLAIVDPDVPTPQNTSGGPFLHLLGGGFQINATSTLLVNSSAALADFFPPTPPAGSDPHRYVVLVFSQPSTFDSTASTFVNASTPRTHFNITSFAGSVSLGNPIGGTFFFTGPSNATTTSASSTATDSASGSTATVPAGSATTAAGVTSGTASGSVPSGSAVVPNSALPGRSRVHPALAAAWILMAHVVVV